MGVPSRFVREYPQRVTDLLHILEGPARDMNLLGSFGLLAASAVLTIPFERMKAGHFLIKPDLDGDVIQRAQSLNQGQFMEAAFWEGQDPGYWREYRVHALAIDTPDQWRCVTTGLHPFEHQAANTIGQHSPDHVIRIIRNALAHGNIVYLDQHGQEVPGEVMQFMAFLTPYDHTEIRLSHFGFWSRERKSSWHLCGRGPNGSPFQNSAALVSVPAPPSPVSVSDPLGSQRAERRSTWKRSGACSFATIAGSCRRMPPDRRRSRDVFPFRSSSSHPRRHT